MWQPGHTILHTFASIRQAAAPFPPLPNHLPRLNDRFLLQRGPPAQQTHAYYNFKACLTPHARARRDRASEPPDSGISAGAVRAACSCRSWAHHRYPPREHRHASRRLITTDTCADNRHTNCVYRHQASKRFHTRGNCRTSPTASADGTGRGRSPPALARGICSRRSIGWRWQVRCRMANWTCRIASQRRNFQLLTRIPPHGDHFVNPEPVFQDPSDSPFPPCVNFITTRKHQARTLRPPDAPLPLFPRIRRNRTRFSVPFGIRMTHRNASNTAEFPKPGSPASRPGPPANRCDMKSPARAGDLPATRWLFPRPSVRPAPMHGMENLRAWRPHPFTTTVHADPGHDPCGYGPISTTARTCARCNCKLCPPCPLALRTARMATTRASPVPN